MIITKQKAIDDLIKSIDNSDVFIIGCSECATICHTGGQEEVLSMKKVLEEKGLKITGWVVLEPACNLQKGKLILKNHQKEIEKAKKILVLACGSGVQTVSEIIEEVDIVAGCDTLFLGEIKHADDFEKRCTLCGDCVQDVFYGLCPVARCPKSMLNGPCGGVKNGKCEVSSDIDCVWDLIYKKLKKNGQLDRLKKINKTKNWSFSIESRRVI
ncbi:MAG: methylenetetrahydrofolate reductase C-terminal domain-containing protein [Thermoplasmatota archaeon]|jgi:ferredoxin